MCNYWACEAFVTYESGITRDHQGFEANDEPVWILGRENITKTSNKHWIYKTSFDIFYFYFIF